MLLLAIASHRSEKTWPCYKIGPKSDADMAVAARIGLAMNGDAAVKYLDQLLPTIESCTGSNCL